VRSSRRVRNLLVRSASRRNSWLMAVERASYPHTPTPGPTACYDPQVSLHNSNQRVGKPRPGVTGHSRCTLFPYKSQAVAIHRLLPVHRYNPNSRTHLPPTTRRPPPLPPAFSRRLRCPRLPLARQITLALLPLAFPPPQLLSRSL